MSDKSVSKARQLMDDLPLPCSNEIIADFVAALTDAEARGYAKAMGTMASDGVLCYCNPDGSRANCEPLNCCITVEVKQAEARGYARGVEAAAKVAEARQRSTSVIATEIRALLTAPSSAPPTGAGAAVRWACPKCSSEDLLICGCEEAHIDEEAGKPPSLANQCPHAGCLGCGWSGAFPLAPPPSAGATTDKGE